MVDLVRAGDADGLERATTVLAAGGLVAFPTETVYGLGADAANPDAVAGIYQAKGRPVGHPLIVHGADASILDRWGRSATDTARALADAFWPGPLTIIVDRGEGVAPETVGGRDSVGLRVPDHPVALDLLARFDGPVAAPSANRFGAVSPTTADHVIDDLGDRVDLVIDGGPSRVGVESTIIEVLAAGPTSGEADPPPRLLRPGGISVVELEAVIGAPVVDGRSGQSRAPGMLVSHYAPQASVELVAADDLASVLATTPAGATQAVGLIGPEGVVGEAGGLDEPVCWTGVLPAEAGGYAAGLYGALRAADQAGVDRLIVVAPEYGPLLDAVVDRLTKAAAPRPAGFPVELRTRP